LERTTVGSLLRSTQAHHSQLCEKRTLEYGIAYFSERFPDLPEANQFREVVVDNPAPIASAYDEAEACFGSLGLFCYTWAPAVGEASPELSAFLAAKGFRQRGYVAMTLTEWVTLEPAEGVRVLPARAMRAALRDTFVDRSDASGGGAADRLAEACDERLNDPQYDMFVAVVDGKPAGRCALYQVGDIARLMDLEVCDAFADRGVQRALTAHGLAMAKRLTMRNICAQVEEADAVRREWFERAGFVADGRIVEFHRAAPR